MTRAECEIDFIVESARSRAWEELNAPDPFENQMISASKDLLETAGFLSIAEDRITEAFYKLEGSPMQETIGAYIEKLSDMRCELKSLAEKYERGIRE